jgi:hypothetical protein
VTISEDTIKNAVLRYHREYDRYLKLSARLAEICRFEIVEGNAIRAQVAAYIVSSGDAVSDGLRSCAGFDARFQEFSKVESGGLN